MSKRSLKGFDDVLRLSLKIMKQLEQKETPGPYEKLLAIFLSGSTRILASIRLLYTNNFPEDGMALFRNLLELCIDLEYIKLDKRRAESFIEFSIFRTSTIFEKPDSESLLKYKAQFKNKIKWSQLSLEQMLKEISPNGSEVVTILKASYQISCMYSHSSVLGLSSLVGFFDGDYKLIQDRKICLKGILSSGAPVLVLLVLDRVNSEFNLDNAREIKRIFRYLPRAQINS